MYFRLSPRMECTSQATARGTVMVLSIPVTSSRPRFFIPIRKYPSSSIWRKLSNPMKFIFASVLFVLDQSVNAL